MKPKQCTTCGKWLPHTFEYFYRSSTGVNGLRANCKDCCNKKRLQRAQSAIITKERWAKKAFSQARYGAIKRGIEFTISELPSVPDVCPIFGVPFVFKESAGPYGPSVDRIDSAKGYVPGNVQIISTRANMLKNDASCIELLYLGEWIKKVLNYRQEID